MQQTITIRRRLGADHIDADVEGVFAIHETLPIYVGDWTLTHVPTGMIALRCEHRSQCVAARAEWLANRLDWTISETSKLTKKHKLFGRHMQKKYGHIR